jgi:4-carboxymuconolactone decarboxylase
VRLDQPRIPPVPVDQWPTDAPPPTGPLVESGQAVHIFGTLANHPALMRRWMRFANHVLFKSTLPARERELVILRVGHLCEAGYEWGQHVVIAREVGVTDDEIRRVRLGPTAAGWSELDRLLLTATDELRADTFVTDATWNGLAAHLSVEQLMDLVFTVGQYVLVSMALNSFGVQPDEGLPGWDLT